MSEVRIEKLYYSFDDDNKTACVVRPKRRNIKSVQIPDQVDYRGIHYRVTKLGNKCFYECSSLKSITLPEGVTELGNGCYRWCSSLKSITLPDGVTKLGWNCFEGCSSLTDITLPESVTELGESCFEGCSSLTSITLPEGMTKLENYCFDGCKALKSITLPEGVTELGYGCFTRCDSLDSVMIYNPKPPIYSNSYFEDDIICGVKLFVPNGSVEAYKGAEGWSKFRNIYSIP